MRLHPAAKKAKQVLRKAGFDAHYVGTLSMHIISREYSPRPLIVDIKISQHSDHLAKLDVCQFCDLHPMFAAVSQLNGAQFEY